MKTTSTPTTSAQLPDGLRTSDEWLAQPAYKGIEVLDPDGWNRNPHALEASWNERITEAEFNKRLAVSTCLWPRDVRDGSRAKLLSTPPAAPAVSDEPRKATDSDSTANILSLIDIDKKLAALSSRDLILEVLATPAADYRCVIALMNRVHPEWQQMSDDIDPPVSIEANGPISEVPQWALNAASKLNVYGISDEHVASVIWHESQAATHEELYPPHKLVVSIGDNRQASNQDQAATASETPDIAHTMANLACNWPPDALVIHIDEARELLEKPLREATRKIVMAEKTEAALRASLDYQSDKLVDAETQMGDLQNRLDDSRSDLTRANALCDKLAELMQEFCDRVDRGEVRSVKTYTKFKTALAAYRESKKPNHS